ncbi:DEAD/DEAH box helicase [Bdellovibrio bacteriovorus]|uniref:DEAD/DEAH box helicase n=1 Tax=Bdellovibrio bacteriovorus TaxID=959 RepID=UPI0035A82ABA
MSSFSDFGLLPSLLKTLKEKNMTKPTEVQNNTIPLIMGGQSVVGVAETGSGKTLAYALPLLHMLKTLEDKGEPVTAESTPRAIVMVPTRELGEQVSKVFKTLTHGTRLRVRPALGGMAMEQARRNTSGEFEILLATPGRLVQMMDLDFINLTDVRALVFDEADQMMDQGFLPDSNKIYYACPKDVQLALFSATVSPAVQELINNLFSNAEIFRSAGSGKVVKSLTTQNRIVKDGQRWPVLEKILKEPVEGGTILFANTREQCDKLAKELADNGYVAVMYRGEMEKNERRTNLKKFTEGKVKFLVATDLAGRGLDISNVDRVINYHLPKQQENYLHRAGRTARAGRKGVVINLVTERDERLLAQLEGRKLPEKRDPSKYNSRPQTDKSKQLVSKGKPAAGAKPASSKSPFKSRPKFESSAPKRRG